MAWDTHPQSAGGWLYVLEPTVAMKARVNMASATYPTAEITYDGVTVGGYTGIHIGQTVLIGSTEGAYDLGRTYLRAAPTSSVLPIGWSSRGTRAGEVTLTDNAYITVLDVYEVWYKPGRFGTDGAVYKDYDLAGTTPPSPIMHVGDLGGLGRIGFTASGALSVTAFDWGGSTLVNDGETWAARNWDFGDGTITSGTTASQAPDVDFPQGARWVRLYGEASGGGETYRRYLVVALEPTAPGTVRFTNLKLTRTAQGQTLTADLHELLDPADYLPGTVVMYLAKERRGATETIVQRFAGWLDVESSFAQATQTHTRKGTAITAVDVAGKLAQLRTLPTEVENEENQGSWLTMVGANPERYIHRHLAFETTALSLADWTLTGLTASAAYPFMAFSTTGGTMYGVCDALARAFGRRLTCDSNGRLWLKTDPMRQNSGDRTATVQRHIGEADWTRITWESRPRASVGLLKMQYAVISGGYASTILTPFPDVFSVAPGESPGQGGGEASGERGIVQSQTEANERTGHDYARLTAAQGRYTVDLAHGVDADIEPANMTWVTITAAAGNAGYRGPTLSTDRGLPEAVTISVDAETGVSKQSLTWERERTGEAGARDPRPAVSTVTPNPPPPIPPVLPLITNPAGLQLYVKQIAAFNTDGKVYITQDFTRLLAGADPVWDGYTLSITGTMQQAVTRADSPLYARSGTTVNGHVLTDTRHYTLADVFSARTLGAGTTINASSSIKHMQFERGNSNWGIIAWYTISSGVIIRYTTDGGATWSSEIVVNANYEVGTSTTPPGLWMNPYGNGEAIVSVYTNTVGGGTGVTTGFSRTTDYGATWSSYSLNGADPGDLLAAGIYAGFSDTSNFYTNKSNAGILSFDPRIFRNTTDVSPTISGDAYGLDWQFRSLAVADDDPRTLIVCGSTNYSGSGARASFLSHDRGASWTQLSSTNIAKAREAYAVSREVQFLMGIDGYVAAVVNGYVFETLISGAAQVVGLMGGATI